jgi:hypothetical protein
VVVLGGFLVLACVLFGVSCNVLAHTVSALDEGAAQVAVARFSHMAVFGLEIA